MKIIEIIINLSRQMFGMGRQSYMTRLALVSLCFFLCLQLSCGSKCLCLWNITLSLLNQLGTKSLERQTVYLHSMIILIESQTQFVYTVSEPTASHV